MYTRVYAESSPRQLVSGKGPRDAALPPDEVLDEFENHSILRLREPTRLVSVSSRIVDTVKRAFDKQYYDNEPAAEIWIVLISEPIHLVGKGDSAVVHHAEELAEHFEDVKPVLFRYEYLFEGAIPEDLVIHRVSLQTLLDRGLDWYKNVDFDLSPWNESTSDLCNRIANDIWRIATEIDFWEVGTYLGCFASLFGARANVYWIANQLLDDCIGLQKIYPANLTKKDTGLDIFLIDSMFGNQEFIVNCEVFAEERDQIEHNISKRIEEFSKKWGVVKQHVRRHAIFQNAERRMWDEIHHDRAVLEYEAIKIGL